MCPVLPGIPQECAIMSYQHTVLTKCWCKKPKRTCANRLQKKKSSGRPEGVYKDTRSKIWLLETLLKCWTPPSDQQYPPCTWKGTKEHKGNIVQTLKRSLPEDWASQKTLGWIGYLQFSLSEIQYHSTSGWQEQAKEGFCNKRICSATFPCTCAQDGVFINIWFRYFESQTDKLFINWLKQNKKKLKI